MAEGFATEFGTDTKRRRMIRNDWCMRPADTDYPRLDSKHSSITCFRTGETGN
jgi:hypothetical protein